MRYTERNRVLPKTWTEPCHSCSTTVPGIAFRQNTSDAADVLETGSFTLNDASSTCLVLSCEASSYQSYLLESLSLLSCMFSLLWDLNWNCPQAPVWGLTDTGTSGFGVSRLKGSAVSEVLKMERTIVICVVIMKYW